METFTYLNDKKQMQKIPIRIAELVINKYWFVIGHSLSSKSYNTEKQARKAMKKELKKVYPKNNLT